MHVLLTGNTTFKLANFRQGLIRDLIGAGHKVTVLAPVDDYVAAVHEMGCDFMPITMDRNGTSPVAEARLLGAVFQSIRRIKPDIVLSYTIKNNIYAGLSCRVLGIPFVPNVTGLGPSFNKPGVLNRTVRILYAGAFRRAHTVFFQNTSDLAIFAEARLVAPERAALLPGSGVDLEKFDETPLPDTSDGLRFLLVARMLWDKGPGIFAEAAAEVRKQFPQARFQLLGPLDPDSRSGIPQHQIEAWIAEGSVEYLGTARDVLPFLKNAHCIVLPSYYREGTPRSLLEAAAVGRPIITTDMPGCRDLVPTRENGFIVPPRDAQSLATACIAILGLDPEARAAMGQASRRLAEDRYDERIIITAYRQIMEQIA